MKKKTESIRTGAFKSGFGGGPNTPIGGIVAANGTLNDYGYAKGCEPHQLPQPQQQHHHPYTEDILRSAVASPIPSTRPAKADRASYQEHKRNKFSRSGADADGVSPAVTRATTALSYHGIGGGGSFTNLIHDDYRPLMDELKEVYRRKIKPLETTYNFEGFHSAPLSDSDIEAKPMVLLLGQYSTVGSICRFRCPSCQWHVHPLTWQCCLHRAKRPSSNVLLNASTLDLISAWSQRYDHLEFDAVHSLHLQTDLGRVIT